ncbi:MAG: ISAs1 family transposase [Planctomycetes bacterium]|nr:ISAs1 family transposase [Planctomycetota bacterium]
MPSSTRRNWPRRSARRTATTSSSSRTTSRRSGRRSRRRSRCLLPPSEHNAWQAEVRTAVEEGKHGGRVECRRLWATSQLNGFLDWPGVGQVCRIERTRRVRGVETRDVGYAITSLRPENASARDLLAIWRGHWRVENRLHRVRDVTLGEDACRVTSGSAPQVLAALRNAIVFVLHREKVGNRAEALREFAWNPPAALSAVTGIQLT